MQGSGDDPARRRIGLDYLRAFVIVLVVLHHAVLAYCTFGHFNMQHYTWSTAPIVDSQQWRGFDLAVLFNDSYFMPLMFLLSGLFVGPSLTRKGSAAYLRDRARRLALPFALAELTIMPLAYYASYRMTGATIGFGAFWVQTVFHGPWPSGPPWFVAVLFGFDLIAVAVYPLLRRLIRIRPRLPFWGLFAVSVITWLPLLIRYGPDLWFTRGPLAIQESRAAVYLAYFLTGVVIGPSVRIQGQRPVLMALLSFIPLVAVQIVRPPGPTMALPLSWLVASGVTLALFCTAATRAFLAVFARFEHRSALWDSLSDNAYGIFLVHYLFVLWGQYALLDSTIGAIPKAACVFIAALALSWLCTAAARHALRAPPSAIRFSRS